MSISRRDFFKWVGVGTTIAAAPMITLTKPLPIISRDWLTDIVTESTWTPAPDLLERLVMSGTEFFDVKAHLLTPQLERIASTDLELFSKPDDGGRTIDSEDIQFTVMGAHEAGYVSVETPEFPVVGLRWRGSVHDGYLNIQIAAEGILTVHQ